MSEKNSSARVPIKVLAVYSVLLYSAWTVYHFFILRIIQRIPNEAISAFLNDGLCKNLVWTLPAVLLIFKYSDLLSIHTSEFFKWKKENNKYLLAFPAFIFYILLGMFTHKTAPAFSINITQIMTVIFVGITEELVFRAWLLNATVDRSEYGAIAVNAIMFLAIHFPRWISEGVFVKNMASMGFLSILILSVVFSLVFLRTRNILVPILLHMFWDFLVFFLY